MPQPGPTCRAKCCQWRPARVFRRSAFQTRPTAWGIPKASVPPFEDDLCSPVRIWVHPPSQLALVCCVDSLGPARRLGALSERTTEEEDSGGDRLVAALHHHRRQQQHVEGHQICYPRLLQCRGASHVYVRICAHDCTLSAASLAVRLARHILQLACHAAEQVVVLVRLFRRLPHGRHRYRNCHTARTVQSTAAANSRRPSSTPGWPLNSAILALISDCTAAHACSAASLSCSKACGGIMPPF